MTVFVKAWVCLLEPMPLGSGQDLVGWGLLRRKGRGWRDRDLIPSLGQDPALVRSICSGDQGQQAKPRNVPKGRCWAEPRAID